MTDICLIGHITKDIIKIEDTVKKMTGGAGYYTGVALGNLGADVTWVTKLAKEDMQLLDELAQIKVFFRESEKTTVFENIYPTKDFSQRIQRVRAVAEHYTLEDPPEISPKIFHICPLTQGEISIEVLKFLSKIESAKISLDVQGFMRKVDGEKIVNIDWQDKEEVLSFVDILKVDDMEAKILTGEDDMKKAAEILSDYGPDEIIITSDKGALNYYKGECYFTPFSPRKLLGRTGRGDTYMGAYLFKRLTSSDFDEVAQFAAALTSLKLETPGPFRGTKEDVEDFQAKFFD